MNSLVTREFFKAPFDIFDAFLEDFAYPTVSWRNQDKQTLLIDLEEEKDKYILTSELPGVEQEQVILEVKDNHLTLKVERTIKGQTIKMDRSLKVTDGDLSNADAVLKNGILTVTIPKIKTETKRIEIKSPTKLLNTEV